MADDGRGEVLYEYRPPRAHPILYAAMMLFLVVLATGSLENALREDRPELYGWYALPLLAALGLFVAFYPSDVRIHRNGIQPSRPLILRWHRPFRRWDELAAVYPAFYDVTGAFVSPFASSDGKVTQLGLGLEGPDKKVETVRFTPTRFTMWQPRSRGYREALEVVRTIYRERGEHLTPFAPPFTPQQKEAMVEEASRPFMPFFAIVLVMVSAAPVLWFLTRALGVGVGGALPVALFMPLAVMLRSYMQSRYRNQILNTVAKANEFEEHTLPHLVQDLPPESPGKGPQSAGAAA